jgi:CubicO group peptidase (beta-lactamase class C family)
MKPSRQPPPTIFSFLPVRYAFVLLAWWLTHAVWGQHATPLNRQIQTILAEQKLAGAVWATVDSMGRIKVDCAGFKNKPAGQMLRPTDRVHVGSITKTVLALGMLRLVTEGKISLADPLTNYLPDLTVQNPRAATHPIRIEHLLDHTAGLEDVRLWHILSAGATPDRPLAEVFRRDPSVLLVRTRPGSVFSYSNIGYTLAGMVIEAVTHQRYETYLNEQLLKPLGMTHSTFDFVTQTTDTSLAYGHVDNGEVSEALPVFVRPATQLTTTAYDMGVLMNFLMSNGQLNGKPFVGLEWLSQLGRPVGTDAARLGLPVGYRLGMWTRDRHGVVGVVHSGSMVGYNAMLYLFPRQHKAFFIAHNMDSETADYDQTNQALIRSLNLPKQPMKPVLRLVRDFTRWAGYYLPVVAKYEPLALIDLYANVRQVRIEKTGVVVDPMQKQAFRLEYLGDNKFRIEGRQLPSMAFFQNPDGQMVLTDGLNTLRKVPGATVLGVWLSLGLGALGFVWLLLSGLFQWFRFGASFWQRPIAGATVSGLLLLLPVPLLATQSFMIWGDFTVGSGLLALATGLLPFGLVIAGRQHWRAGFHSSYARFDAIAILLTLQSVGLMAYWHLIPFRLWV